MTDYADLEKRLRGWAALHDKCGQQGTRTPLLAYEAADALASLTKQLDETDAERETFRLSAKHWKSKADELAGDLDERAYDMPVYGLHTQRKALLDIIAFVWGKLGPSAALEQLYDELRFPENKLDDEALRLSREARGEDDSR